MAWVNPKMGEMTILVFNEPLYFGNHLKGNSYGVVVLDAPKQLDKCSSHEIYVPDEAIMIPLDMKGVVSYFESHKASAEELQNCQ
jgi:hypothetical protein